MAFTETTLFKRRKAYRSQFSGTNIPMQLGEDEKLHEYFISAKELKSRLSDAGEQITETLFNALVINSLLGKYEHFAVQESFNPASAFTELRTHLQNYEETVIYTVSETVVYKENNPNSIRNRYENTNAIQGLLCLWKFTTFCKTMQQERHSKLLEMQQTRSFRQSL